MAVFLAKSGVGAEEILTKLLETDNSYFVHMSLVELLKDECLDELLDRRVSEVLEMIHVKDSTLKCEENSSCTYHREKLKKKAKEP
jgi:hypothetical protein